MSKTCIRCGGEATERVPLPLWVSRVKCVCGAVWAVTKDGNAEIGGMATMVSKAVPKGCLLVLESRPA